ncbi:C40 family peptidase [Alteribacillus bidgolensis]|uniref:Cell wall-associated hydrolase, NlpC family n=1 Tax=Alteribacillus bidgolensis TaxID=930129 RepID=A0A1G8M5F0_9BACI|nr:peptidoglycan-binding protein [Alteribacillus bidgolensis]SDI63186.1 Cell wall-associated hydrolase, NlpC family [Alteribacillus bidgolensis]
MFETTTTMKKVVVTSTTVTGAILAAPLAADAALGDDTLYPGTNNDEVKKLQDLLRDKGYFTYHTTTGYYGDRTKEAVLAFQKKHNLTADGIAGPQTFGVLLTERTNPPDKLASSTSSASKQSSKKKMLLGSSTILRLGDQKEEVTELQRQLHSLGYYNGDQNGYYGRQLKESVKKFQREENLAVDGIAGPQTFAALKSVQVAEQPTSDSKHEETDKTQTYSDTFKVLSSGDKNSDVSLLQRQLKDLGYYNKDITGIFGPMTEKAVRKFQINNNLQVDGMAGPKTLNKIQNNPKNAQSLKSDTEIEEQNQNNDQISSELRYESRGQEVEALQAQLQQLGFLKMEPTGVYGEVTEHAVKDFQQEHGLQRDGVAGPVTLNKLKELTSVEEKPEEAKPAETPSNGKVNVTNLVADAAEHIGTPYVWGGSSSSGFDCSGFLQYVFKENGVELPRTVAGIYDAGTSVDTPRVGDIVFFETYQEGPSHAGIYMGNDQFIHSGSSTGVTVSNMNTSYWDERYLGVKRYF